MSKTKGFLLAVAVAAMGFTFSCSSDDDGGGGGGGEKGNDIGNYKTVVIGTQTWMAENLNYAVEGSKCFGEDGEVITDFDGEDNIISTKKLSSAEVQANCTKYGRLYDWATAMALPPSCNERGNHCKNQVQPKHKGICPSGWHIPSWDDWEKLLCYVANENGFSLYESSEYEKDISISDETLSRLGMYLKATSGWNDNGADQYGFSALPGGAGFPPYYTGYGHFYFYGVGDYGLWWSTNGHDNGDADMFMVYGLEYERYLWDVDDKPNMYSVRCVKDVELPGGSSGGECGKPSSSSVPSSSSSVPSSSSSGGGSKLNLSDLPKQLYYEDYHIYEGNIIMRLSSNDSLLVGRIQNGQVALDLPASINSKYLESFSEGLSGDCTGLNYPSGLSFFAGGLEVNIPGGSCEMYLSGGDIFYFSKSGSITGNCDETTWDVRNFSEGWNVIISNYISDYDYYERSTISNSGNLSNSQWMFYCHAGELSSSSTGGENPQSYSYCVYPEYQMCLDGPYTSCSSGGILSNSCPFGASSSSLGGGYTGSYGSLDYQGQIYKTVQIGEQVWFAENLNYAVEGSKCYDNDPAYCQEYGRLYDWETAMALPQSCNSSSCSNQVQLKHRGICPAGWHIPSDAEWTALTGHVGSTAGTKLKANSDLWNSNGKGTDEFGFSALPGGFGDSSGSFHNVGNFGDWWSATEYNASNAYRRDMDYIGYDLRSGNVKSLLVSVRCVQD